MSNVVISSHYPEPDKKLSLPGNNMRTGYKITRAEPERIHLIKNANILIQSHSYKISPSLPTFQSQLQGNSISKYLATPECQPTNLMHTFI